MKSSQEITIRRGLPPGAEGRAAELYWEAFGRKLGPALNPPDKAVGFIAAHLNHDRAVAALAGDRLVGLAGYRHAGRALTGGTAGDVLRSYGLLSGLPRLALLALLERDPAPGELVMDGIAVDPACRGTGVGTLLLQEIVSVAAALGHREVRLDVIDGNPRARALYERHGFTATGTERTPYLRDLMGFGAVTTMRRPVAAPEGGGG
ncbi:GNAT family N-acetyltransferase [Planomonospora parontospora]|uniref:GNAT family N-acetyltransferase n=1 Tax=Planomonospora parontospora TaxID=58119 RepID=UPI00167100DF|nr:GNAT family N-acetyltransferase [Planomonospora parontospora]GGL58364.1 molybdopterin-guanine dinucleotide biosynthesis protein MobC [Planomonospora parontospora subsp. antibiotica]GII20147.1 molybdopterin-guanine dinucleotide biosynthesis protein MobC [Planomonospora parontospora subsp. antibiotica]